MPDNLFAVESPIPIECNGRANFRPRAFKSKDRQRLARPTFASEAEHHSASLAVERLERHHFFAALLFVPHCEESVRRRNRAACGGARLPQCAQSPGPTHGAALLGGQRAFRGALRNGICAAAAGKPKHGRRGIGCEKPCRFGPAGRLYGQLSMEPSRLLLAGAPAKGNLFVSVRNHSERPEVPPGILGPAGPGPLRIFPRGMGIVCAAPGVHTKLCRPQRSDVARPTDGRATVCRLGQAAAVGVLPLGINRA